MFGHCSLRLLLLFGRPKIEFSDVSYVKLKHLKIFRVRLDPFQNKDEGIKLSVFKRDEIAFL